MFIPMTKALFADLEAIFSRKDLVWSRRSKEEDCRSINCKKGEEKKVKLERRIDKLAEYFFLPALSVAWGLRDLTKSFQRKSGGTGARIFQLTHAD